MSEYTDKICPIIYSSERKKCFGEECAWFSKCYTLTTEDCSMVGEWLHKRMPHDSYHITGQCSICKERSRINNYCPWCGAKMKEADDD